MFCIIGKLDIKEEKKKISEGCEMPRGQKWKQLMARVLSWTCIVQA